MPTATRPRGRRAAAPRPLRRRIGRLLRCLTGGSQPSPVRRAVGGAEAVDRRADLVADFPGPDSEMPVEQRVMQAQTMAGGLR